MVAFSFRVGAAFRGYPSHPITIPKGSVDYREVDRAIAAASDVAIVFPDGVRLPARIANSVAGFGEYRQIRTLKSSSWASSSSRKGQIVDVSVTRQADRVLIVVRERG